MRLLDTRNIYEYDLGTFAGAEHLNIDNFVNSQKRSSNYPPKPNNNRSSCFALAVFAVKRPDR